MSTDRQLHKSNRKLVGTLSLVVVAMFGFGYALVPLYNLMCDVFGINGRFLDIEQGVYTAAEGTAQGKTLAQRRDLSRTVNVQFITALNQNLDWEFRPLENSVRLHPGEIRQVRFHVRNRTDRTMVGQAIPSVTPGTAVKYFTKMQCFCFEQQTFAPGESREMPLIFVVDPDLPARVGTITLAYTFFDTQRSAQSGSGATQLLASK